MPVRPGNVKIGTPYVKLWLPTTATDLGTCRTGLMIVPVPREAEGEDRDAISVESSCETPPQLVSQTKVVVARAVVANRENNRIGIAATRLRGFIGWLLRRMRSRCRIIRGAGEISQWRKLGGPPFLFAGELRSECGRGRRLNRRRSE